jgi:hypothetical protein
MSVDEEIKKAAARIGQAITARLSRIQGELRHIEAKKAAIEAELRATRGAEERLFNFQPQVNCDFQCPTCWVQHEKRSVLSLGEGKTPEAFWRCDFCGFEMITSAVERRACLPAI